MKFHKISNALVSLDDIAALVPKGDEYIVILKSGATFILEGEEARVLWEILAPSDRDWRGG